MPFGHIGQRADTVHAGVVPEIDQYDVFAPVVFQIDRFALQSLATFQRRGENSLFDLRHTILIRRSPESRFRQTTITATKVRIQSHPNDGGRVIDLTHERPSR